METWCKVTRGKTPADAEAVRFLWKEDPFSNEPPDHYQMLLHIFGATDSPCCASYALKRAALDQIDEFPIDVTNTVMKEFYMDDLLPSVRTKKQTQDLIKHLERLMKNRGFNLTKFCSNSNDVLRFIPCHDVLRVVNVPHNHPSGLTIQLPEHLVSNGI